MYEQVEKPKESKSRAVASSVAQNKSNVKQGFGFVDTRPKTNFVGEQDDHMLNFQKFNRPAVQLMIDVNARRMGQDKVVITAAGKVDDFKGGTGAKQVGWNRVEEYEALATVNGVDIESGTINNKYLVAEAGHVLASQNGGNGGDSNNVFAQDGGVNNGPFRSHFENPMRAELNKCHATDPVKYQMVLIGSDIYNGDLSKQGDVQIETTNRYKHILEDSDGEEFLPDTLAGE